MPRFTVFHYLKTAFWAFIPVPGLGEIPFNVLAILAFFVLGLGELIRFGQAGFWLLGFGLEVLFLFSVAFNKRFQNWVDAQGLAHLRDQVEQKRQHLIRQLSREAQMRVYGLEEKIGKIEQYERTNQVEPIVTENNQQALQKLLWIYLKLLIAQQNASGTKIQETEKSIKQQIDKLMKELANSSLSTAARESKAATLKILQQRLDNFARRQQSLDEIVSDLTRIEAQIDLALENATLGSQHPVISSNIELVSSLLQEGFYGDAELDVSDLDRTFS